MSWDINYPCCHQLGDNSIILLRPYDRYKLHVYRLINHKEHLKPSDDKEYSTPWKWWCDKILHRFGSTVIICGSHWKKVQNAVWGVKAPSRLCLRELSTASSDKFNPLVQSRSTFKSLATKRRSILFSQIMIEVHAERYYCWVWQKKWKVISHL